MTPGKPMVQLDGRWTPTQGVGLDVADGLDGSTIRGLSITGFSTDGIELEGPPSVVEGNYIGLAPDGTAQPQRHRRLQRRRHRLRSDDNRRRRNDAAARNVISGNDGAGINFANESGTSSIGNYIGTNPAGDAAAAEHRQRHPLRGRQLQIVGGTGAGAGNLISGNGVLRRRRKRSISTAATTSRRGRFQGNTIGLAADGVDADAERRRRHAHRVRRRRRRTVGGTAAGAGNVISGNARRTASSSTAPTDRASRATASARPPTGTRRR